ncbi:hypothetical protein NKH77_33950 [Streptomyces sp. M19]
MSELRDDRGEAQTLLLSVAELFVRGAKVDWAAVLPEGPRRRTWTCRRMPSTTATTGCRRPRHGRGRAGAEHRRSPAAGRGGATAAVRRAGVHLPAVPA